MNKIKIVRGSEELASIESSFVPEIGEVLWFDSSIKNPVFYTVDGRVFDVDLKRNRLNVTLLVK